MKIKKHILLILLTILFFTCKKYEQGGNSMEAKSHLTSHHGNWLIDKYEVNGVDSSMYLDIVANAGNLNKEVIIKKEKGCPITLRNKSYNYMFYIIGDKMIFQGYDKECTCGFKICNPCIFMPENSIDTHWKIIKLTKTEVILSCSLKKSYLIKLIVN